MTVDTNMVVSLSYKLTNHKTGELIEETSESQPMEFLYGVERIIPTFEVNIHGLKPGDTFEFDIPSAEAYGDKNDDHVALIPISVFFDESGEKSGAKTNRRICYRFRNSMEEKEEDGAHSRT